jgi:hypothetical protein
MCEAYVSVEKRGFCNMFCNIAVLVLKLKWIKYPLILLIRNVVMCNGINKLLCSFGVRFQCSINVHVFLKLIDALFDSRKKLT